MSLESNNLIIEKYTPNAKYPMDYFYPGPPLDQSGSNSSTSQYRVSLLIIVIPDEKILTILTICHALLKVDGL